MGKCKVCGNLHTNTDKIVGYSGTTDKDINGETFQIIYSTRVCSCGTKYKKYEKLKFKPGIQYFLEADDRVLDIITAE